jgi:hypothetical protein
MACRPGAAGGTGQQAPAIKPRVPLAVFNLKLRGAGHSLEENGHHADFFGLLSELGSAVSAVT